MNNISLKIKQLQKDIQAYGVAIAEHSQALKDAQFELDQCEDSLAKLVAKNPEVEGMVDLAKRLYVWNWAEGGYNQCYAVSREDALAQAAKLGSGVCKLTVAMSTFKRLDVAGATAYWANFPLMD